MNLREAFNSTAARNQLMRYGNRCELVAREGPRCSYHDSKYGKAHKAALAN